MPKFLVVSMAEHTDSTGMVVNADGELGGDDYIEFKDQKQAVLGNTHADDEQMAREQVALDYGVCPDVLHAYMLHDDDGVYLSEQLQRKRDIQAQQELYETEMNIRYGMRKKPDYTQPTLDMRNAEVKFISIDECQIDPEVEAWQIEDTIEDAFVAFVEKYPAYFHISETPINIYYTYEDDGKVRLYTQADKDFDYHTFKAKYPVLF
jgi:hypothetical protein